MANKKFGEGFARLADSTHITQLTMKNTQSGAEHVLPNVPGKQASVRIYFAISRNAKKAISSQQAQIGLQLFGDYVTDELNHPDAHPNIRLLLNIIDNDEVWQVAVK